MAIVDHLGPWAPFYVISRVCGVDIGRSLTRLQTCVKLYNLVDDETLSLSTEHQ